VDKQKKQTFEPQNNTLLKRDEFFFTKADEMSSLQRDLAQLEKMRKEIKHCAYIKIDPDQVRLFVQKLKLLSRKYYGHFLGIYRFTTPDDGERLYHCVADQMRFANDIEQQWNYVIYTYLRDQEHQVTIEDCFMKIDYMKYLFYAGTLATERYRATSQGIPQLETQEHTQQLLEIVKEKCALYQEAVQAFLSNLKDNRYYVESEERKAVLPVVLSHLKLQKQRNELRLTKVSVFKMPILDEYLNEEAKKYFSKDEQSLLDFRDIPPKEYDAFRALAMKLCRLSYNIIVWNVKAEKIIQKAGKISVVSAQKISNLQALSTEISARTQSLVGAAEMISKDTRMPKQKKEFLNNLFKETRNRLSDFSQSKIVQAIVSLPTDAISHIIMNPLSREDVERYLNEIRRCYPEASKEVSM